MARSSPTVASSVSTASSSFAPGITQVISSGRIPVLDRLSAQPTLAAITCCSLAIATIWHCGLPSTGMSGNASFSVMRPSPLIRRRTTSGATGLSSRGPYTTSQVYRRRVEASERQFRRPSRTRGLRRRHLWSLPPQA